MLFASQSETRKQVVKLRSLVSRDFGGDGKGSPDFQNISMRDGYYLNCWRSGGVYMHHFKHSSRQTSLLELNVGGGSRAQIGVEDGQYFLLRSTMAIASGQRHDFPTADVSNQPFYVVGAINRGIGEALLDFYLSGSNVEESDRASVDEEGYEDLGPSAAFSRRPCVVIPKHHPVAVAAKAWLFANGYKQTRAYSCRPDFYVQKGGRNFVVEVKPSASLQSAALALGQLSIYSAKLDGAGKIAIFPKDQEDQRHGRLRDFDQSIEVVYV
jgi:hypothetical protein